MSSVRKYVLKPFEADEQGKKEQEKHQDHAYSVPAKKNVEQVPEKFKKEINYFKKGAKLKMENILKIIAIIALVNGYDDQRRIRSANRKFVPDTDIVKLIMHAMQPGKVLTGEDKFVNILREAKVDPNLLFNDNVRSMLKTSKSKQPELVKQVQDEPTMYVDKAIQPQFKRKRPEDRSINVKTQRRKINWDYSNEE